MSREITTPQRQWTLEKWYFKIKTKPSMQHIKGIVSSMALDDELTERELNLIYYPQNDDAERSFKSLASVVSKNENLFSDFVSAVNCVISEKASSLLNEWHRRSKVACTPFNHTLSPNEREVLNSNTVPDRAIITCPRCHEIMKWPMLLRCLHSFCRTCAPNAGGSCPVCRLEHHQEPAKNMVIARHMKYLAIKIAGEKCKKCEESPASAKGTEKPSEFCEQCFAFFCSKHVCDFPGHRKVATEEYLKRKEMELYKLTCETHECDMTCFCQHCHSFHCVEYPIFSGGEHTVLSFSEFSPNAKKVITDYLDDIGHQKAVLLHHQPENLCSELQNFYEGILKTNKDLAVAATEAALNEAKPDIIGYCSSLAEHSKTLRSWIDQADMYLNFLVRSKAEWIAEQWSVISQQLPLLMRETGFVHSDAFQHILADGRLQSLFQSDSATDIKFARLQVHYVDPSSKESTAFAFIKELIGVPTKENPDTPAHLGDILLAIKESSNSLRYQKKEVDMVAALRLELEEKDSTILRLQREIDRLQSQVLHSNLLAVELLSSQANGDDRRSTGVPVETVLGNLKIVSHEIVEKLTKQEADKIALTFASKSWLIESEEEKVREAKGDTEAAAALVHLLLKKMDNKKMIEEFVFILEEFNRKDLANKLKGVRK